MTALLQTLDLCCERDERLLVDRLNLTINAGTVCQVEGPNGSGKTTLLRVLCGLSSRYRGEILWRGQPVSRVRSDYLGELLYLGHSAGIKSALSPRENLAWHHSMRSCSREDARQAIESALVKVGLYGYEDAPCYTLSAGQQRRVGLARLFLTPASLWILDEPFTAIDKQGVAELEGWIAEHAGQGGSVLLTTHHQLTLDREVQRLRLGLHFTTQGEAL